ncbi:MAG: PD-(D/E)XK nuclease family protein [Tissierellia bacterium]|nr:PD-(D/E)XK nuclease family protein [Tissierellia bacterium]
MSRVWMEVPEHSVEVLLEILHGEKEIRPYENCSVVVPNRITMATIREKYREKYGGFTGIDLFTFDELAERRSLRQTQGEAFLPYLLKNAVEVAGGPMGAFLSHSDNVRELLPLLEEAREGDELPYLWGEEVFPLKKILEEVKANHGIVTLRDVYAQGARGVGWGGGRLILYGFYKLRPREWALLEDVSEITAIVPFGGQLVEEEMGESAREFAREGFELIPFEGELTPGRLRALQGRDGSLVLNGILRELCELDGEALDEVCVVTTDGALRRQVMDLLEVYGIPLANPLRHLDARDSRLLGELGVVLGVNDSPAARLSLSLFPLTEEDDELRKIFALRPQARPEELLAELEEGETSLNEEQVSLLLRHREALGKIPWKGEKFSDFCGKMREALDRLEGELLLPEEVPVLAALEEAWGEFSPLALAMGRLTAQEFMELLIQRVEEVPHAASELRGVTVLSWQQALGVEKERIYIMNLTSQVPAPAAHSFRYHSAIAPQLRELGLLADDDDRYGHQLTTLSFLMAHGREVVLCQWGDEEDRSLVMAGLSGERIRDHRPLRASAAGLTGELPQSPVQLPSVHSLQVGEIGSYLRCPYAYYLEKYVFDLLPRDEEGRRRMALGTAYHKILEQYYKKGLSPEELPPLVEGEFSHIQDFPSWQRDYYGQRALAHLEEFPQKLKKELSYYRVAPEAKSFEVPVELTVAGVLLRGRVDRLDQWPDGREHLVDYKRGSIPSNGDLEALLELQLPIYALAREREGHPVGGLSYYSIERGTAATVRQKDLVKGRARASDLCPEDWPAYLQAVEARVTEVVEAIQKGDFPRTPQREEQCEHCKYVEICRRDVE